MKLEVPAVPLPVLRRAASSTLDAVRRFATGLYDDYQAVKAGVTLPWSSGPVEGHINRYCQVVGDNIVTRQQKVLSGRDCHRLAL